MSLITLHSQWYILLCVIASFIITYYLYRKDKKSEGISKNIKLTMFILRFLSVTLISILLLGIFIKSISKNIKKPIIIFAQDNSESLKKQIDSNYVIQQRKFLEKLSKNYDVKKYTYGENVKTGFRLTFNEKETDISQAVSEINNIYFNENVGALILSSDGIYNKGKNPVYETDKVKFPIYTIALGDTTINKDIAIQNVKHNEIVFLNNTFTIETTISATKLKGKESNLNVFSNKKLLYSEKIFINSDNFFKKINLEIKAEKAGIMPINIVVKAVNDEKNIYNNSKQIVVEVTDLKQKVLILANSPHPDISAVKNSLEINQNLEIEFFLINDFKKNINEYNLIILHQIPSKTFGATDLLTKISTQKIPVLFILGRQSDLDKFNNLRAGLVIERGSGTFDEVNGYLNKDFDLFKSADNIERVATQAPPLISPFGNYKLSALSQVFLNAKIKNLETGRPLILFSSFGSNPNNKTAIIAGEGLWRWRMFDFKTNNNHYSFDELINKTAQYLTLKELKERFIVKTPKIINENNDVIFDAEIYNKSFELINNQDVNLSIKDSSGKQLNYIFDKTVNAYSLNAGNFKPGEYSWKAETLIDGKNQTKSGIFRVLILNSELQNTIANFGLLYQIAVKTNAKMFFKNDFDKLYDEITANKNIVSVSFSERKLENVLNWEMLLILIILITSAEWLLRKLYGLI